MSQLHEMELGQRMAYSIPHELYYQFIRVATRRVGQEVEIWRRFIVKIDNFEL